MNSKVPSDDVVLVVDDNDVVLSTFTRMLKAEPVRVLTARTGREAIDVLEDVAVDVAILDYELPDVDGLELCRRIRSGQPSCRRVMVTGHANLDLVTRAINEGEVFRFLEKPIEGEALRRTVAEALQRRESNLPSPAPSELLDPEGLLSDREREVATLVASGLRVPQVAKRLFISPHTVRNHLKAAFRKLDVHSQADLVERYRDL